MANVRILQYAIRHVFERNYIQHEDFEAFVDGLYRAVKSLTNTELDILENECKCFLRINPYQGEHIAIKRAAAIAHEKKIRMLNVLAYERQRRNEA